MKSHPRAAEMLAGRGAQLKTMLESAGGEIRSAGASLEAQAAQFREAVETAAAVPRDTALELDRQAKQIESAADTAVARAEFVLARQERQRTAMAELLGQLKEDAAKFDVTVEAHCATAQRTALVLSAEAKKLDEIADDGLRRIDAAMANAETRTSQLSAGFGREAERVKETADSAATSFARVVEGLREAAESARLLIAETTSDSQRRSKDFVGEAMGQCDQLLRAASSVAEQAEKARAILAKAADDAERHIVSLPGMRKQEAAHVREAMRQETELMLDMSARTLATLQSRVQRRAAGPITEEPPPSEQPEPAPETGERRIARTGAPHHGPETQDRGAAEAELSAFRRACGRGEERGQAGVEVERDLGLAASIAGGTCHRSRRARERHVRSRVVAALARRRPFGFRAPARLIDRTGLRRSDRVALSRQSALSRHRRLLSRGFRGHAQADTRKRPGRRADVLDPHLGYREDLSRHRLRAGAIETAVNRARQNVRSRVLARPGGVRQHEQVEDP